MKEALKFASNKIHKSSSISKAEFDNSLKQIPFALPQDYLEFMQVNNGGIISFDNTYLDLWSIGNLIEWNKAYNVDEFANGYFIFASNGGGTAYAFNKGNSKIVEFEFIGMLISNEATFLASTFTKFIEKICC